MIHSSTYKSVRRFLVAAVFLFSAVLALSSCNKEGRCHVLIGEATCQIDPNSPLYPGINNCDGYEYLVGGANGLVVVRVSYNDFACFERSCPLDSGRLEMAEGFGNIVLECPKCHSRFNTFADGCPLEGSRTSCYLYQYSTYYDGSTLYISNY